uniref:Cysteine-rich venom protein ENH1-like n=1 Tax=Sinocyclocheilus rhinocerous TaxID=307959 RepID=A0A673IB84_9TELE
INFYFVIYLCIYFYILPLQSAGQKDAKMFAVTVCVCTDLPSVQQEIVDVHNAYRRAVEPTASNMLKMVNHSLIIHILNMHLRYEMGENLFKASAVYSWTDVINAWHSEVNNYEYPTGSTNGQAIGHHTQVVWYSSYEVGCAVAQCGSSYFYGCHYYRAKCISVFTNPCPYINTFSNCDELKEMATCDHSLVSQWCPASCLCEDKIVPIARK